MKNFWLDRDVPLQIAAAMPTAKPLQMTRIYLSGSGFSEKLLEGTKAYKAEWLECGCKRNGWIYEVETKPDVSKASLINDLMYDLWMVRIGMAFSDKEKHG